MRDAYARVLTVDSSCTDCYLGLGVYQYGLARASALARLVAKIVGLGSGNAERGIAYMRRGEHPAGLDPRQISRSEEHTSELQSRPHLVCRLLLAKKNKHVHNYK